MPVIFIHGVNVRNIGDYDKDVAMRDELLRRLVIQPLAETKSALKDIHIANPYWGGDGVSFRWHHASLPKVDFIESLGVESSGTPQSDIDIMTTIMALSLSSVPSRLEPLGVSDRAFQLAALKNPVRLVEAILSPVILSETRLAPVRASAKEAGLYETLLMLAARDTSQDSGVRDEIRGAVSDQLVIETLKNATQLNFERLLRENNLLSDAPRQDGLLEPLGPVTSLFTQMKDRVGEIFDRALDAPTRAASIAALTALRGGVHRGGTQFLGDVFVYLNERDAAAGVQQRGPIISTVLDAINNTPRERPDEPLIVITHSMGGNILYDIVTHYQPTTVLSAWVSVASQAGEFEEMKLFKVSDKTVRAPQQVRGLRDKIKYWLNVYDPADILAFLARPVFEDADEDFEYHTGASAFKAHSAYFKRPSFYDAVRERLERALP